MKFLLSITLAWALSMSAFAEETPTEEPPVDAGTQETVAEETQAEDLVASDSNDDTPLALKPRLPLNELRVFAEAFNRISSAYVEEIDDKTLLEYAIVGMLSQLDPHSAYLDKDSFDELQCNVFY